MDANQVPGAALAITKDGRLVYAAGFGYANKETGEEAGPTSLFRIASVSKPFTSAAIMKLIEAGNPKLTDKVFGPGSILGGQFPTPANNKKIGALSGAGGRPAHQTGHYQHGLAYRHDHGSAHQRREWKRSQLRFWLGCKPAVAQRSDGWHNRLSAGAQQWLHLCCGGQHASRK